MFKKVVAVLTMALFVVACSNDGTGYFKKENVGTVAGAAVGGILGSNVGGGKGQIAATIVGTLLGAYAGSEIGASLDRADRQYADQAAYNALEYNPRGQSSQWYNPDSGNSGSITPTQTYQQNSSNCREYTQTINVGGRQETAVGQACRQADGTWKIVS